MKRHRPVKCTWGDIAAAAAAAGKNAPETNSKWLEEAKENKHSNSSTDRATGTSLSASNSLTRFCTVDWKMNEEKESHCNLTGVIEKVQVNKPTLSSLSLSCTGYQCHWLRGALPSTADCKVKCGSGNRIIACTWNSSARKHLLSLSERWVKVQVRSRYNWGEKRATVSNKYGETFHHQLMYPVETSALIEVESYHLGIATSAPSVTSATAISASAELRPLEMSLSKVILTKLMKNKAIQQNANFLYKSFPNSTVIIEKKWKCGKYII